jgi:hypothetical protein
MEPIIHMFYVLKCMSPLEADHYSLKLRSKASRKRWEAGVLFSETDEDEDFHPPAESIELNTQPEDEEVPNVYAELYWNPIPLFTRRLVAALHAAGVDNLQTYDTKLVTVQGTNPPPADHYLAVNIVGRVAAADLPKSERNPDVEDSVLSTDFYSLAVDETKARDLFMFRLIENITAVLVHDRVKRHVEGAGIRTLTWIPPEKWAG